MWKKYNSRNFDELGHQELPIVVLARFHDRVLLFSSIKVSPWILYYLFSSPCAFTTSTFTSFDFQGDRPVPGE